MTSALAFIVDVFLHLDDKLQLIIAMYGGWTYAILFLTIFAETGLVVTPFLPGDSLLFAAGAYAGTGALSFPILLILFMTASILGDSVNYAIGRHLGTRAFQMNIPFLKQEHLLRTQAFFDRHGGKAVAFSRFLPILRTVAPFVAGVARMDYARFSFFNVVGATAWVGSFVTGGYLFGNLAIVRENFTIVILAIIVVSISPAVGRFIWQRFQKTPAKGEGVK